MKRFLSGATLGWVVGSLGAIVVLGRRGHLKMIVTEEMRRGLRTLDPMPTFSSKMATQVRRRDLA